MPAIVPIVEGDGDVEAVPVLVRALLAQQQAWGWTVARPKKAGGLNSLRSRLADFLRYADGERDCGGILILIDLDDGCAREEALQLAAAARAVAITHPTAIVFACREYEAWFLASIETIAGNHDLPAGLVYPGEVEARRGVKEWLRDQMPRGKTYKETIHQVRMTAQLDLGMAYQRSRSFRRLSHAIAELVQHAEQGMPGVVTPNGDG